MKTLPRIILLVLCARLYACAGLEIGDINAKVCKDDVCIGFTIPGQKYGTAAKVAPSAKEVIPVQ